MNNQNESSQILNGRNINELDLNELKQMEYQRPAREFVLDTQEIIRDKDCWCKKGKATKWFKIRKVEYSQHVENPSTNEEIWGRCDEHLSELKEKEGKVIRIMMGWQVRYDVIKEIKKMTDEEFENEKEELKKDIIKQLNFHGFLGYQPKDNKVIQHGIFRRLARKMKMANWNLNNKLEIEEWLTKASKGKYTEELLKDFWDKAQEYKELKALWANKDN